MAGSLSPSWIASDGSPHIVLPREALALWHPHEATAGAITQYDVVCKVAVQAHVGPIQVQSWTGLILGNEVPLSRWIAGPTSKGGTIVIALEWDSMPSDEIIAREIRRIPDVLFVSEGLTIRVGTSGLVLFVAADNPGKWGYGHLDIDLEPGLYTVSSHLCEIDDYLSVRLFRLCLIE